MTPPPNSRSHPHSRPPPPSHTIDWTALIHGDKQAITALQSCLNSLCEATWRLSHASDRNAYVHPLNFGVFNLPKKHGLRYLTGEHLLQDGEWIIPHCAVTLPALLQQLDAMQVEFVECLATDLFAMSPAQVAEASRAPLLRDLCSSDKKEEMKKEIPYKYGLFDLVEYVSPPNYGNEEAQKQEEGELPVVVSAHCDPGLFAFSLFSDQKGLQLWDPTQDCWYEPPIDSGVIWCGTAANTISNGRMMACNHRVYQHIQTGKKWMSSSRLTMWQELSVPEQLPASLHRQGLRGTASHHILGNEASGRNGDQDGKADDTEINLYVLFETGQPVSQNGVSNRHPALPQPLNNNNNNNAAAAAAAVVVEEEEDVLDKDDSSSQEEGQDSMTPIQVAAHRRARQYKRAVTARSRIINDRRSKTSRALHIKARPSWTLLDVIFAVERAWNTPFAKMAPQVWFRLRPLNSRNSIASLRELGVTDGDTLTYGNRPSIHTVPPRFIDDKGGIDWKAVREANATLG